MKQQIAPVMMGLFMGPMLLWMLHGQLVGDGNSFAAAAVFVGTHVLILIAALSGGLLAARISPTFKARLDSLHRPSWKHLATMIVSAITAASAIHFTVHGAF